MEGEKEADHQKDNIGGGGGDGTVASGSTGDLGGRRGVRPTSAPNSELIQTLVKQIKSEIYGWSWCEG